jgi:hypothetical protein
MAIKYVIAIEIETQGEINLNELENSLCKGLCNEMSNMQDYKVVKVTTVGEVPDKEEEEE